MQNKAETTVAAVILGYAEQQCNLPNTQSECVIKSLQKAEDLRLDADCSTLLRLAAIIPIVAASLQQPEDLSLSKLKMVCSYLGPKTPRLKMVWSCCYNSSMYAVEGQSDPIEEVAIYPLSR